MITHAIKKVVITNTGDYRAVSSNLDLPVVRSHFETSRLQQNHSYFLFHADFSFSGYY